MSNSVLLTTVVGSYPQPDWLVNRELLKSKTVARTRFEEIWRVPEEYLESAQDSATLSAIHDMEHAGIDIITDGEIRRESYSNRFATALGGVDTSNPHRHRQANGTISKLPRVVDKITRHGPVEVRDMEFLRKNTDRNTKITLPGPFTMAQQAHNEYYKDDEEMVMAFADAANEEVHDLVAAGADYIQLDEPWLRNNPDAARRYAVRAINRALSGVKVPTVVHLCFGYAHLIGSGKPSDYAFLSELSESDADQISIEAAQPKIDLGILSDLSEKTVILGVIDLADPKVESAETVAARVRAALKFADPRKLVLAPDCGMKYLARDTAFGKLRSIAEGAMIVRRELS